MNHRYDVLHFPFQHKFDYFVCLEILCFANCVVLNVIIMYFFLYCANNVTVMPTMSSVLCQQLFPALCQ